MLWQFGHLIVKKQEEAQPGVPLEIQQYYQSESKNRGVMAWLLAGGTLVATILIVIGLFFGGRWVYRKFANRDNNQGTQTAQTSEQAKGSAEEQKDKDQKSNPQSTPAPQPTPAPQSTPTPAPGQGGGSNANLPNTGPEGMLASFVVATVLGTILYNLRLRRKVDIN